MLIFQALHGTTIAKEKDEAYFPHHQQNNSTKDATTIDGKWCQIQHQGFSFDESYKSSLIKSFNFFTVFTESAPSRRRGKGTGDSLSSGIQRTSLTPNEHSGFTSQQYQQWRRMLLLIMAITIHNIPEGLAVGVGFGAVGSSPSATFQKARYGAAFASWKRV